VTETGSATKAFKPWYRVYQHEDQVIFHYGDSVICLKGRAAGDILTRLLPVLDGRHSVDDIASISNEDAKVVNAAINLLERYDLLMNGSAPAENDELARTSVFLSAIGGVSATQSIHERLAAARVEIIGSSNAASELLRGLHGSGIVGAYSGSVSDFAEEPADLTIVAPSTSEVSLLRDINKTAIAKRRPWLQLLPYDGRFAAIGPLFVPGETACYECFQLRRASNVKYSKEYLKLDEARSAFEQCMPLDMMAAGLGVLYALRWIGANDPALVGRLIALQPLSDRGISTHDVLRVPRCPACAGVVNVTAPSPWFEG
jgi:bacteriocin biosynthesis cyclodehydratase domain-containing protein